MVQNVVCSDAICLYDARNSFLLCVSQKLTSTTKHQPLFEHGRELMALMAWGAPSRFECRSVNIGGFMFVALTLAIKRREAPKMSHTQFLRSPKFALTPIWCAKQKGGLIILLCILIFMAQCVVLVVPCGKTEVIIGKSPMCRYR